jgi:cytochrome c peroxidase
MTKTVLIILLGAFTASTAMADTPIQLLNEYAAEAGKTQKNFTPSADRGRAFFREHRTITEKMENCASCHTEHPTAQGKHVVTGKIIEPLAPTTGSKRFTDRAKTEKWFGRNCKEVIGRECTAAEKADLIRYLQSEAKN